MPTVYPTVQKTLPFPAPAYPPLPVRRFTVDEYHRMIQTGILRSGERLELIHGWIVPKMPSNPSHSSCIRYLDRWLQARASNDWVVSVQQPITTGDSEPELDLAVCDGPRDRYLHAHPGPDDVALLIEVSDTSLGYDTGDKLKMYAKAGIAVYWVVDIENQRVIVHSVRRRGRSPKYLTRVEYCGRVPVVVRAETLGTIAVSDLLP